MDFFKPQPYPLNIITLVAVVIGGTLFHHFTMEYGILYLFSVFVAWGIISYFVEGSLQKPRNKSVRLRYYALNTILLPLLYIGIDYVWRIIFG